MSAADVVLRGKCACDAVTWTSSEPAAHLDFCYCSTCSQISGVPLVGWMGISRAALTWHGPILHFSLKPLAIRGHCGRCGSTLTIQYHCYPKKTHVAAGTVVEGGESVPPVGMHIWVKGKPAWYTIPPDGVEQWGEFDPQFARVLREEESGSGEQAV